MKKVKDVFKEINTDNLEVFIRTPYKSIELDKEQIKNLDSDIANLKVKKVEIKDFEMLTIIVRDWN